jgi:hypothetical protein
MQRKLIAIVGSADTTRADYNPSVRNHAEAKQAAERLGAALAKKGYRIIVYSPGKAFIESDVVRGFVKGAKTGDKLIIVDFPIGHPGTSALEEYSEHKKMFEERQATTEDWEISFYRSVCQADGILLIGGGRSTLITGVLALTHRIPLIALSAYGGNAQEVWKLLNNCRNLATDYAVQAMARQASDQMIADCVESLEAQASARKKELEEQAQVRHHLITGSLLVAWVLVLATGIYLRPPQNNPSAAVPAVFTFLLFLGPLISGASGARILALISGADVTLGMTIVGAAAGVICALFYVVAQFVSNYSSPFTFIVLCFDVLFGFIGGLTADQVFKQLQRVNPLRTDIVGETRGRTRK